MRKIYTLLAATLMLATIDPASAQGPDVGGTLFNNDIVGYTDLYNLSFTSHNYGTARSMAMGNAFTALGADMVSASLNPAGIGMYVASDVSLSMMMQFTKSPTTNSEPYYIDVPRREQTFSDHTERFALSSAGGVFTVYRGTGALTNFNMGVVYNRIADFNQNSLNASRGNFATQSMAQAFCTISNADNLQTDADGKMPFGNDPYYWGEVLAYKNGVTNKDDAGWYIDRIGETAEIDQYSAVETRGSIGEYAISLGFNFIDKFYVGATLGIQSVNYKRNTYYGENYIYAEGAAPSGAEMPYQLDYMNYMQRTEISGSGINFKVGATWRPVSYLRFGVAYHTPTYYSLSLRYDAEMWSRTYSAGNNPDGYDIGANGYMYDNVRTDVWEDAGPYGWAFRSPSRLLTGAAVTIAKRVIISADYERSWYQNVRLKQSPINGLSYPIIGDLFKGSNTVRVGAEAMILPSVALRAGYIWSGSTLRPEYKDAIFTRSIVEQQSYITAGVGFNLGRSVYLDLAYQYNTTKYSPFKTFYVIDSGAGYVESESSLYTMTTKRHIATLTFGVRF